MAKRSWCGPMPVIWLYRRDGFIKIMAPRKSSPAVPGGHPAAKRWRGPGWAKEFDMCKRAYCGRGRGSGKSAPGRVTRSGQVRQAFPRLVAAPPDIGEQLTPQGFGHCRRPAFAVGHEDDKSIEYSVDPEALTKVGNMRVFLRNFFLVNDKIAIDVPVDKAGACGESNIENKTVGFYGCLGKDCVGLFAMRERLFVYINGKVSDVPGEGKPTSYSREQGLCVLRLSLGGEIHMISYCNARPSISTLTYSEDEEDADFGLWLHNVLASDERRRIVIGRWGNGIGGGAINA